MPAQMMYDGSTRAGQQTHVAGAPRQPRYGTMAARVNTTHSHRLGIDTPSARAGTVVILDVKDITRFPEEAKAGKWICKNPFCAGKTWASKSDLLAAHPDNRKLAQQQEIHLYYCVYEKPYQPAQPAVDKKPAVDEQPAKVLLLCDEE